jgi:hypothetical protein
MRARFGEFNPKNKEQMDYINAQIGLYKQYQSEITSFDNWTGGGVLLALAFLFYSGVSVSSMLVLTLCVAFVCLVTQSWRPEHENSYRDQLDKMLEIYLWCANSVGSTVTQCDTFINVLEAIYKDVPLAYLLLWDPSKCKEQLSEPFVDILSRRPHSIPSYLLRKQDEKKENENEGRSTIGSYVGAFFITQKEDKNVLDPDEVANRWYKLYEASTEALSHLLYAYRPSEKCDLLFFPSQPQPDDLEYRPALSRSSYILTKEHLYFVDVWNKSCIQVDSDTLNIGGLIKELKLQEPVIKKGDKLACLIEDLSKQQLATIAIITNHHLPSRQALSFPYSKHFLAIKEKIMSLAAEKTVSYALQSGRS